MKRQGLAFVLVLVFAVMLSGCVVRTYSLTKDRVDQDLAGGNRGYLQGNAPEPSGDRPTTRTTQVVEVELGSPIKFEKAKAVKETAQPAASTVDSELYGNRGYISQTASSEPSYASAPEPVFEQYTVQKGDTLQKISTKFFGTTKKWPKIYDANKDTLKGPDKVRVGQTLNIPKIEGCAPSSVREPAGNLK